MPRLTRLLALLSSFPVWALSGCVTAQPRQPVALAQYPENPADPVVYHYFGIHEIPASLGGGWCDIDEAHDHLYAPDAPERYRVDNGVWYWNAPIAIQYYDFHPDPFGSWCHSGGFHFHPYVIPLRFRTSIFFDFDRHFYFYAGHGIGPQHPGWGHRHGLAWDRRRDYDRREFRGDHRHDRDGSRFRYSRGGSSRPPTPLITPGGRTLADRDRQTPPPGGQRPEPPRAGPMVTPPRPPSEQLQLEDRAPGKPRLRPDSFTPAERQPEARPAFRVDPPPKVRLAPSGPPLAPSLESAPKASPSKPAPPSVRRVEPARRPASRPMPSAEPRRAPSGRFGGESQRRR